MALYLGLDSSTQSLTAIVLEVEGDRRRVVFESSLAFDDALPGYGTCHGVLPHDDAAVAMSSPLMWAEAVDVMLARLSRSGLDLARLAAISGSAQQHGSVYLNRAASARLAALNTGRALVEQVADMLSRPLAPIWMDSSTRSECREITAAVGGADVLAQRTGSRAFERFTGPQIRKFFKEDPAAYEATDRIHLISSFLASLLIGRHAPVEPGDGSGMNLMDLATSRWWPAALDATAPGLAAKLGPVVAASSVVGTLSPYWQARHGLPPANVIAWSGDNPCSLIGTGLVREGRVAVSLGTSDTMFGLMLEPRVDPSGTGHVFGSPTGVYMGLTCFKNGSLARERVRDSFGLTWVEFSHALEATSPGNLGRILLPWYEPEITPAVPVPGLHRYGLTVEDAAAHVRGVIEGQQMALALHSRWMGVEMKTIYATGGAATNREILQVMADVFGAKVYQFGMHNAACLGAALRALHADRAIGRSPIGWDDVIRDFAEPVATSVLQPDPARHATYRELIPLYAACEAHALGRGPDPARALARFHGRV